MLINELLAYLLFIDANQCKNTTCMNGGKCMNDSINGLPCACPDGFSGDKCETSMII